MSDPHRQYLTLQESKEWEADAFAAGVEWCRQIYEKELEAGMAGSQLAYSDAIKAQVLGRLKAWTTDGQVRNACIMG